MFSFVSLNGEAWFYEGLFFEVVVVMLKDKKIHYKRNSVNKN